MIKGLIDPLWKKSKDLAIAMVAIICFAQVSVWLMERVKVIFDPTAFHTALEARASAGELRSKEYTDLRFGELKESVNQLRGSVDGLNQTLINIYGSKAVRSGGR